jgi:hypothetical protein
MQARRSEAEAAAAARQAAHDNKPQMTHRSNYGNEGGYEPPASNELNLALNPGYRPGQFNQWSNRRQNSWGNKHGLGDIGQGSLASRGLTPMNNMAPVGQGIYSKSSNGTESYTPPSSRSSYYPSGGAPSGPGPGVYSNMAAQQKKTNTKGTPPPSGNKGGIR